jgi:uridine phosphorylase
MLKQKFPILEFDPNPKAIFGPEDIYKEKEAPSRAVMCFFGNILDEMYKEGQLTLLRNIRSEMGVHPLYLYQHKEETVLIFHPGVGAPLAAAIMEEVIQLGSTILIACGGAGVLDHHLDVGHPIIPTAAVRDEGTSYHYLPPGREVEPHPLAVAALKSTLDQKGLAYHLTKTWTTDGIYRETIEKRELRIAEGCDVVEMEAASLFAVAKFRNVICGQILYAGDLVHPDGWDGRKWNSRTASRKLLLECALDAVVAIKP